MVYDALNDAGFGPTYYRLRDLTPARRAGKPARVKLDALRLSEMDTASFLEEHTQPAGESARLVTLYLDGVHCAACVWLVERMPYELEGVWSARLDLPRARLALQFDPGRIRLSAVARWLARFGYLASPSNRQDGLRRTESERRLLIRLGVCWRWRAT
jgi:Cu2+-exporting ATPase